MLAALLYAADAFWRAWHVKTQLPVCEVERRHVTALGKRLRPFKATHGFRGAPPGSTPRALDLSAWRLAHAVVKAEFLTPPPYSWLEVAAFVLNVASTLDWRQKELRLFAGASRKRTDFAGTSLAGRIGQGLALLTMEQRGYLFHAHYPRAPNRRGPDFIVQHVRTPSLALVEAKGSFVSPNQKQQPKIKTVLREGLMQLEGCEPHGATKSFVVATILREVDDAFNEPSLVALVDPELDGGSGNGDPRDWVIRENYAAWLRVMGLNDVASDLRRGVPRAIREPVVFWRKSIGDSEYLLTPIAAPYAASLGAPFWWHAPEDRCVVVGVERAVLKRLQAALKDPPSAPLVPKADDTEASAVSRAAVGDGFYGSVMADGSIMGAIRLDALSRSEPFEESIEL